MRGRVLIVEQSAHCNEAFHERMQDHWWGFDSAKFCGWMKSAGFEEVGSHGLATVDRGVDAPDLFVVVGVKPGRAGPGEEPTNSTSA